MNLKIQFPWRTIPSNLTSHLNDIHFTSPSDGYIVGANGEIQKTSDKGETFTSLTSNTTETLNSVWFLNSNTGFCVGNNGLILNTNNAGLSWSMVPIPGLTHHLKSIFFVNESIGFIVGTNGTLYKTINGGSSWFNIAPSGSSNDTYNSVLFLNSNYGYVVGNNGKFIMTQDGGTSWILPYTSFTTDLTDLFFVNASKGFVVGSSQIFETTNGGYSWYSYTSYPTLYQDITFKNSQVGFAVGYYGTIMKTNDGGSSWQKELTCTTNEFMAVCARDSFFIAVGKNGIIAKYEIPQQISWSPNINIDQTDLLNPTVYPFQTTNYAVSVLFEITPDFYDSILVTVGPFSFNAASDSSLYCGNNLELKTKTDWYPIYNKQIYSYKDQFYLSPDTGFVITEEGTILKTTNGAYTWDSIAHFNFSLNSLKVLNSQIAYIVGNSSLIKSINGGLSWVQIPVSTPAVLHSVDFINPYIGFVCGGVNDINGSNATILKTTDGGENWEVKHLASGYDLKKIYFINDTTGFAVGTNGIILRTSNGGDLWNTIPNTNLGYLNSIHFISHNIGYIIGSGIVLKTTNGGLNWDLCQGPFNYSYLSSVVFPDSLTGYILGTGTNSVVVFKTVDGGNTWTTHPVNGVSYIPNAISFPTKNTGYLVGYSGTMAKIEIPDETWTPSNFVFQNSTNQYFANPNQTTIFSVSAINRLGCLASDQVSIQVYPFYANYTHNHTISCGSSIVLELISHGYTGSDPLLIQWSPNIGISDTTISSPVVSPIQSQLYNVQFSTSNGCVFNDSILINITPLIIDAGYDKTINCGEEVQLNVSSTWAPVASTYHYFNDIFFTSEMVGYGVSNGVYKTTNGGYTWEVKFQSDQLRKILFVDSLNGYAVGYGGLVAKTVNGNYFNIANYLYNTEPRDLYFIDKDTGYVICDGGKIRKTINGTTDWINIVSGTTQNLNSIHFTSPAKGYIVGEGGTILKTTNYGQTWTPLSCGTTDHLKTVYFLNDSIGFIISALHQSYKTTNGGETWALLSQLLPSNSIYFTDHQTGYATGTLGATGAIAKTTNGGNTWVVTPYFGYSNFYGLSFPNPNTGYLFATGFPQNALLKLPVVPSQIVWSPSLGLSDSTIVNPIASPTQTTTYTVSTIAGYCPAQDNVTVNVIPFTIQNINYDTQPQICKAIVQIDSISTNYQGMGSLNYQWIPSASISNIQIENPTITTDTTSWFSVTITTPNGCIDTDSLIVVVLPLMVEAGQDKYLYCGETVQLDSIITNYSGDLSLTYLWSPSYGLSDSLSPNPYAIPTNLLYTVTVTLDTLCSASDHVGVYYLTMEQPSICIVTVDSSNKNVIVFEKPISNAIDSFMIYRETNVTGQYEIIGSLRYDSLSMFVDQTSTPSVHSNQYKISLVDECGIQSLQSEPHKTMHLSINQGVGQSYNLIWQPYTGFTVSTYNIYRGTDPAQLQLLGTISGVNTQYSDLNPPSGYVYYQVEVVAPYFCAPTKKSGFNSSRSNIASNNSISVSDFDKNGSISVSPNPTNNFIQVKLSIDREAPIPFTIYNLYGEKILSGDYTDKIDVSDFANGVYVIQLEHNGRFYRTRFAVQK